MRPVDELLARRLCELQRIRRFLRREDGGTLIESAVSIGTLLMFLMAIVAGTMIVFADIFVGSSAHMATRYAMVRGSTFTGTACSNPSTTSCAATNSDVASYVRAIAPPGIMTGTPLAVTTTWPGTTVTGFACSTSKGANSPGCIVTVQVIYNFNYTLPLIPGKTLALGSKSTATVTQ